MFDMQFFIVGGFIQLKRSIFLKEMLGKDSTLRKLLDWRNTGDFNKKHPVVTETNEKNFVKISFTNEANVEIGEEYENFLQYLKQKYKGDVKGRVTCQGKYGTIFTFQLDLNSDSEKIEYIPG